MATWLPDEYVKFAGPGSCSPRVRARRRWATHGQHTRPSPPPLASVAVIPRGTAPAEEVVRGTLRDIARQTAHLPPPSTVVIGDVVH